MGRDTNRKARTREYQARAAYAIIARQIGEALHRAAIKRRGDQEPDTPLPPSRVAYDAGGGSQKFL